MGDEPSNPGQEARAAAAAALAKAVRASAPSSLPVHCALPPETSFLGPSAAEPLMYFRELYWQYFGGPGVTSLERCPSATTVLARVVDSCTASCDHTRIGALAALAEDLRELPLAAHLLRHHCLVAAEQVRASNCTAAHHPATADTHTRTHAHERTHTRTHAHTNARTRTPSAAGE